MTMILRGNLTSPYARKVRVVIAETGMQDRVSWLDTDPWDAATDLGHANPLGKVPALSRTDGSALYDSRVIAEYLAYESGDQILYPPPGPARWEALKLEALGDGVCDAAIARLLDTRRPASQQSAEWQARQTEKMNAACDQLEVDTPSDWSDGSVTIGPLTVAVALDYLDLRCADLGWREGRPRLAAWHEAISARPSLATTRPPMA